LSVRPARSASIRIEQAGVLLQPAQQERRAKYEGGRQLRIDLLVILGDNIAAEVDAHRFYKRLGFKPTHTGFKMKLRG
jgi:hypothetical protein